MSCAHAVEDLDEQKKIPGSADLTIANTRVNTASTSAKHYHAHAAYLDSGDGVAVWEVYSGAGAKLLYSLYSQSRQEWSEEKILGSPTIQNSQYFNVDIKIATTGKNIAVIWRQQIFEYPYRVTIFCRIFDGKQWSKSIDVSESGKDTARTPYIISNGDNYAVFWTNMIDGINSADGTVSISATISNSSKANLEWSPIKDITGIMPMPYRYLIDFDVAFSGLGYAIVWTHEKETSQNIYTLVYNGSTWLSEPKLLTLKTLGATVTSPVSPRIAANSSGYQYVWQQVLNTTDKLASKASIYTAGYFNDAWVTYKLVADLPIYWSSRPSNRLNASIVSQASSFLVSWMHIDPISEVKSVNASTGVDVTWSAIERIDVPQANNSLSKLHELRMHSVGDTVAVFWLQTFYADQESLIYSSVYNNGKWNTALLNEQTINGKINYFHVEHVNTELNIIWIQENLIDNSNTIWTSSFNGVWLEASEIRFITSDTFPKAASNGSDLVIFWSRDEANNDSNVYSNVYKLNKTWQDPVKLTQNNYRGSVGESYTLLANKMGDTLALWKQFHNNTWKVYASVERQGEWQTPEYVTDSDYAIGNPAASDDGFIIVFEQDAEQKGLKDIYAKRYKNGKWLLTESIAKSVDFVLFAVTSNGKGYAIILSNNGQLWFSFLNDAGWSDSIITSANVSWVSSIASNGTGYAGAWLSDPKHAVNATVFETLNPTKNGLTNTLQSDDVSILNSYRSIASNGNGYSLAYWQNDNGNTRLYANVYESGEWSQQININLSGNTTEPNYFNLVTNGDGYAAVWRESLGSTVNIYANVYNGVDWNFEATLLENRDGAAGYPQSTSNKNGYAAVWMQKDNSLANSVYSIRANVFADGRWVNDSTQIDVSDEDVASSPSIATNNIGYGIVWAQYQGKFSNAYFSEFINNQWNSPVVLNGNLKQALDPIVVNDGNKYSAAWLEQSDEDSIVFNLWAKMRF